MDDYQIAEAVQDEEAEAAWHATELSEEMMLLASAGLYHSWEKATRRLLGGLARRKLSDPTKGKEKYARLPQLLEMVAFAYGLHPDMIKHRAEIITASLIAHISKHGDGSSLDCLYHLHPEMFYPPIDGIDLIPTTSTLLISNEVFSTLAAGIARYWRSLPSY